MKTAVSAPAMAALIAVAIIAAPAAAAAADAGDKVAARMGDTIISLQEVDRKAIGANLKVYQDMYDARRFALDVLLGDILLEKEAAARKVSVEELTEAEITAKTQAVTDDELLVFFNQNRNRMGGKNLDQVRGQIQQFLEGRNAFAARRNFVDSLKEKAGVVITLDPPRLDVTWSDADPAKGPADAPITIVEFSDFQ